MKHPISAELEYLTLPPPQPLKRDHHRELRQGVLAISARMKRLHAFRFAWINRRGAAVHRVGENGRTFCNVEGTNAHLLYGDVPPQWCGAACQNCAQYA